MIMKARISVMCMFGVELVTWADTTAGISDGAGRFGRRQPHGMCTDTIDIERRHQGSAGMHSKWQAFGDIMDIIFFILSISSRWPVIVVVQSYFQCHFHSCHLIIAIGYLLVKLISHVALALLASLFALCSLHFLLNPNSCLGLDASSCMVVSP